MSGLHENDLRQMLRRTYEAEGVYSKETICRRSESGAREYADELLADKLETVKRHIQPGLIVDLCCATGGHLLDLCDADREGLGLDFSLPYISKARVDAVASRRPNVRFAVADATKLPVPSNCTATLYCLSALYHIPDIEDVFSEIGRVLKPGGRAILDLANPRSINAICNRAYPDLPPMNSMTIPSMIGVLRSRQLVVVEHRAYQILPLWADKPKWLWPLLHPAWKKLLKQRIKGRMIDEWISSSRLFAPFAYRHLVAVQKTSSLHSPNERR